MVSHSHSVPTVQPLLPERWNSLLVALAALSATAAVPLSPQAVNKAQRSTAGLSPMGVPGGHGVTSLLPGLGTHTVLAHLARPCVTHAGGAHRATHTLRGAGTVLCEGHTCCTELAQPLAQLLHITGLAQPRAKLTLQSLQGLVHSPCTPRVWGNPACSSHMLHGACRASCKDLARHRPHTHHACCTEFARPCVMLTCTARSLQSSVHSCCTLQSLHGPMQRSQSSQGHVHDPCAPQGWQGPMHNPYTLHGACIAPCKALAKLPHAARSSQGLCTEPGAVRSPARSRAGLGPVSGARRRVRIAGRSAAAASPI